MLRQTSLYAFGYLRLSREEMGRGESTSIENQRLMITTHCQRHGINLIDCYVDDGWSGGNFQRPGFQNMLEELKKGHVNLVITKDLSRLGRDMREASYYAEQYFPERGIRFMTVLDNFDTAIDNPMAPLQFAMNEFYLRDCSRKMKAALKERRDRGQYCACPPYGYKKSEKDKYRLVPDEATAPIVQRIFQQAAEGNSSRSIALSLNASGVIPPLKYRSEYRDNFTEKGAARASEIWNNTTIKRILQNQVYLGHTVLGKSQKVSIKSKKKVPIPSEEWSITKNTHEPLVSQLIFDRARDNLGRGTKLNKGHNAIRKSIFGGIAVCGLCGYSLCSCGTVYKGEREKYWYLSCTRQRKDIPHPCTGVRIHYADLCELIRQDLNRLISLSDEEVKVLVERILAKANPDAASKELAAERSRAEKRITVIEKIIAKLYADNINGIIDDTQLSNVVSSLSLEASNLQALLQRLEMKRRQDNTVEQFQHFFDLAKKYSTIETLDRETLLTFVERIEVGPKILPPDTKIVSHRTQNFRQSVRIFYKFIGEIDQQSLRTFPPDNEPALDKVDVFIQQQNGHPMITA